MFQRTTIVATVVVIMCAYVGTADGKAKKIKFFEPSAEQVAESEAALGVDADPDGMAILNYASGADKTIVQIIISDMTPLTAYGVRLEDGLGGGVEEVLIDAITTDEDGHGTLHLEFPGIDISTYDVQLFVGTTASGVVWSQLQDSGFLPSPYSNRSLDTTGNAADNFVFSDETQITGVRWWGVWCNPDLLTDEFRVRFYDDNGGLPDTTVGSTFVERNVTPTQTLVGALPVDICTLDPEEELQFEADLTTPFTAAASTTYWIEIVSKETADNQFFRWSNASSDESRAKPDGDGAGAQRTSPNDPEAFPWFTQPDRAFELIGEVDTTDTRASGVNPG